MTQLLNLVLGGVVAGGLYAVLATGVVLTYQTSGVFNFAHGAVAFATAYLFFQLDTGLGWPVPVAGVLSVLLFAPALGWALDRVLYRRLASAPETVRQVVPIALLVAVPSAAILVVDRLNAWLGTDLPTQDQVLAIPGLGPHPTKKTWRLGGVIVDSNQLVVLAAAALAAVALWLLLRHSALGLRMRAVVDRRPLAELRGVDADRTSAAAWMIGSFLAGLAGVLLAPLFTLNPPTFTTVVLISTPAVVLARFRSLPLALAGGLAIGVVQNLVTGYASFARQLTGFRTAVPFLLLYLLLFFFGPDRTRQAGTAGEVAAPGATAGDGPVWRPALVWAAGGAALLAVSFLWADDFWQGLIARGLALGLVLLSFTIVTGVGGMVSLAQAAFVTTAAFTAGWALSRGWPFAGALAAGTAAATLMGVVVSLPARRLGGLPLALSTMALAFTAESLVFPLDAVSNQSRGGWAVTPPALGPVDLNDRRTMIVGLLVLVGLASLLVRNLVASSSGRAMIALRATEAGARTVGIRAAPVKLSVFALSAALAGFGGVFLASTTGRVTTVDFPVEIGFFWLTAAVVFGIRRPAGAVLAGLAGALAPELFHLVSQSTLVPAVMFGLAALNLARNPDGVLGIVAARRRRPPSATAGAGPRVGPDVRTPPSAPAPEAMADGPLALHLDAVRAGYGDVEVVHGVDLVVPRGGAVALVGANGAGKTTLCAVAAGLLAPAHGRVLLDGHDVTREPTHRRVHRGAFLVPEGRGIFPALSVDENLALWLPESDRRQLAYDRFPHLAERREQAAGSLSGGEQQMLALAPALVRPPTLLIADEPSLGLAPRVVGQVFAAIEEIKSRGTAVLLVEEKANDALAVADTLAFLSAGRVAWVAPAAEVDHERLVHSYLGIGTAPPRGAPATGPTGFVPS